MKTCPGCKEKYEDALSFCPRDGEVLESDLSSLTGKTLDGQYFIERLLGRGGMGAVYLARHTLLGDRVAIKILPPEMRADANWVRRFQREAQTSRRFRHPNAVTVHDLRTAADGTIYMVMEYVEGHALEEEMRRRGGKFHLSEIAHVVAGVASALDAAHAKGIIHRDLKPANIMIASDDRTVKLLDLGIAKVTDTNSTALTMTGQVLGTPYYMSPEQWGQVSPGEHPEIDHRADIYSLGVIVYELTAGRRPFAGESMAELRHAHCAIEPPPLEEFVRDVPAAWSQVVRQAMRKSRRERQGTAGEFAAQLKAAVSEAGAPGAMFAAVSDQRGTGEVQSGSFAPAQNTADTGAAMNEGSRNHNARAMPTLPAQFDASHNSPQSFSQGVGVERGAGVPAHPRRSASRAGVWILAAALVGVLFVSAAAIGYLLLRRNSTSNVATPNTDDSVAPNDESAAASTQPFMGYYLLSSASADSPQKTRTTERAPIAPGRCLQFAFTPREDGYIYMTGLDSAKQPVIIPLGFELLTASAGADATADTELLVPQFGCVKLDDKPGTDSFTVIFSRERLTLPLASETFEIGGRFRRLTEEEKRGVNELRRRAAPAKTQYSDADSGKMIVTTNAASNDAKLVVFDINLRLANP